MDIDDISWKPLKPGGASFQMYHVEQGNGHLRLRRSVAYVRFVLFFAVSLTLFPFVFGIGFLVEGKLMPGTINTVIAVAMSAAFVFWYQRGKYLKGGFDFTHGRWQVGDMAGALSEVRAIQVLGERVPKNEYRWTHSYEVNLVFEGACRVNVIDHGHEASALELAETLASRLQVPVWARKVL